MPCLSIISSSNPAKRRADRPLTDRAKLILRPWTTSICRISSRNSYSLTWMPLLPSIHAHKEPTCTFQAFACYLSRISQHMLSAEISQPVDHLDSVSDQSTSNNGNIEIFRILHACCSCSL
ncbi:hypothetical protein X975_26464, partial [Stegodyphus mimosarum]